MIRPMRRQPVVIVVMMVVALAAAVLVVAALLVAWLHLRGEVSMAPPQVGQPTVGQPTPELIARGAYLARVGDCAACHTVRGGPSYAGARGIQTPFGTVFSSNLTPDLVTGIGGWSADDFWRAMHNGASKDGRLLYPAFPYQSYTQVTRADADAIFAFLRTQPPVAKANRAHELRFPYNLQVSLAVWRALFFRPAAFRPEPGKSPPWNRGAYLVRGLGHCADCHATRNALGATENAQALAGGLIPVLNWYAPPLSHTGAAGLARWKIQETADLLRTGTSARGSVLGPMAEVVFRSTQYLEDADLLAMAEFLQDLPPTRPSTPRAQTPDAAVMAKGQSIYKDHCTACHGGNGQGQPGAYPALAGSRKLMLPTPANAVKIVVHGGFPATTRGNPRPYGMPPFGQTLSNADVAAVITFTGNGWGNQALPVSELDVIRLR